VRDLRPKRQRKEVHHQLQDLRIIPKEVRHFSARERLHFRFMLMNLWHVMSQVEDWYTERSNDGEQIETFETWRKQWLLMKDN